MRNDIPALLRAAHQRLGYYVGNSYTPEGLWPRSHFEGQGALKHLIRELEAMLKREVKRLPPMRESRALSASAREHALQMSELDFVGHDRQDPVFHSPDAHMNKYTKVIGQC